MTLLLRRPLCF